MQRRHTDKVSGNLATRLKVSRSVQGWVWRELEQYKTRVCEIGVDGHALYNLEGLRGLHPAYS